MEPQSSTAVAEPTNSVITAIKPFDPDDNHKGTFLVLRIAGLEQGVALKSVNRKYRSLQHWCMTDMDFKGLNEAVPALAQRFGGEARVIRTALLDISIIEAGIGIFKRILKGQQMSDGMWSYAVKMAGIRVPMMGAQAESSSPWERLANSIKNTMSHRELTVVQEVDGGRSVTAKETVIEPSLEQKQIASEIVQEMLAKAKDS